MYEVVPVEYAHQIPTEDTLDVSVVEVDYPSDTHADSGLNRTYSIVRGVSACTGRACTWCTYVHLPNGEGGSSAESLGRKDRDYSTILDSVVHTNTLLLKLVIYLTAAPMLV
jgi:hypothetical protein